MRAKDFVNEGPELELARRLPTLRKHNYTTIDDLVRKVSARHKMTHNALEKLFTKKFGKTPSHWIKGKLDENTWSELIAKGKPVEKDDN